MWIEVRIVCVGVRARKYIHLRVNLYVRVWEG